MAKRKSSHEQYVELAEDALDRVHSDTSVPASVTKRSLKNLRDHLDILITSTSEDGHEEAE